MPKGLVSLLAKQTLENITKFLSHYTNLRDLKPTLKIYLSKI